MICGGGKGVFITIGSHRLIFSPAISLAAFSRSRSRILGLFAMPVNAVSSSGLSIQGRSMALPFVASAACISSVSYTHLTLPTIRLV